MAVEKVQFLGGPYDGMIVQVPSDKWPFQVVAMEPLSRRAFESPNRDELVKTKKFLYVRKVVGISLIDKEIVFAVPDSTPNEEVKLLVQKWFLKLQLKEEK